MLIPGFAGGATVVDSLAAVKSDLGDVRGSILTSRGRQVVYYNRGRVTLVGGQVKEVSLQDDEEIALAQERLRQAREASVKAAALRKERRITRGMALKEGKLGDPVFLASTPELRLRFWLDFMRIYPEVDVSQELQDALLAYQVFKSLREQEERIAEAEERARRAEERAIRAERRARHGFYSLGFQSLFNQRHHFSVTASRGNGIHNSFSGNRKHHFSAAASRGNGMHKSFSGNRKHHFNAAASRGNGMHKSFSGNRKHHFSAAASRGNGMRHSFSTDRPHHRNFTVQRRATAPVRFPTFFSASITSLPGGPVITSLPGGSITINGFD